MRIQSITKNLADKRKRIFAKFLKRYPKREKPISELQEFLNEIAPYSHGFSQEHINKLVRSWEWRQYYRGLRDITPPPENVNEQS